MKNLHELKLPDASYENHQFKFKKRLKSFTLFTLTLMLMFFSLVASAKILVNPSVISISSNNYQSLEDGWVLDTTINKVLFYHKIVLCEDRNVVLLKFDNQNDFEVSVSIKANFKTKQIPSFIEGFNGISLNLKSGLTAPLTCSDENNKNLIITGVDVDPTYIADILDFNFKEITFK